jgi:hypothetical protein
VATVLPEVYEPDSQGRSAMSSLVGVWKLVEARAFDDAGRELPPPLGPKPMGIVLFEAERMVGAIGDARVSLPTEAEARFFAAIPAPISSTGRPSSRKLMTLQNRS